MISLQKSLVTGTMFGALVFVIAFLGGAAITSTLGPGTSGIVTAALTTATVVIAGKLSPRFPTLLTTNMSFAILAIPTTLFGPFGFAKILFGIITGLLYEIIVGFTKRSNIGYWIAGASSAFISVYLIFYGTILFNETPSAKLASYLHYFALVYAVLGAFGAWFGLFMFEKINKHPSVVKFQK